MDPRFLLRLGPSIVMITFGINQFYQPQNWLQYVPSWAPQVLRMAPETIMRIHSVVNVLLGLWLLSGVQPNIAAWLSLLWFLSILPFAFMSDWTIGVRDTALTIGIFALITLLRYTTR